MIPRTYRLPVAGWFALALSPAAGRHSHSLSETAALQGSRAKNRFGPIGRLACPGAAKIEREREKLCHEIFLPGQDV